MFCRAPGCRLQLQCREQGVCSGSACAPAPTTVPIPLRHCEDEAGGGASFEALGDLEHKACPDPSGTCSWGWGRGSGTQECLPFPS